MGDISWFSCMIQRQGTRKVKHLAVRQQWLQQQAEIGSCIHENVPRAVNYSDICTHFWAKADGENHPNGLGCTQLGGGNVSCGDVQEAAVGMLLPGGVFKSTELITSEPSVLQFDSMFCTAF